MAIVTGMATLVVFGAFASPWSRRVGDVLAHVRDRRPKKVRVVWRHYPDPVAHPNATTFALATEAAALNYASGVSYSPALFMNGRRYDGGLVPSAVADALAPLTIA